MIENILVSSSNEVVDAIKNGKTYRDKKGLLVKYRNELCVTINIHGDIDSIVPCSKPLQSWVEAKG